MARKKRVWAPGACYHITHRCNGQEFLFRFQKYRNFYVRHLFKASRRYGMDVLDYIVTCNHVHLLVTARQGAEISEALRYLHGVVGQFHNLQREKSGAFWNDRYHATRIQDGGHLSRCLLYIDLNMVRAGVVRHPSKWTHSAWNELSGTRERCRIVNRERLLECLRMGDMDQFTQWHRQAIDGKLRVADLRREAFWSSAFAVGDAGWLGQLAKQQGLKRHEVVAGAGLSYLRGVGGRE